MVWVAISYFGYAFYVFDKTIRINQRERKDGKGMTKGREESETENAKVYQRIIKRVYLPSVPRLFPGLYVILCPPGDDNDDDDGDDDDDDLEGEEECDDDDSNDWLFYKFVRDDDYVYEAACPPQHKNMHDRIIFNFVFVFIFFTVFFYQFVHISTRQRGSSYSQINVKSPQKA